MVGTGWLRIIVGAHMCPASPPGTDKSVWEHYNELMAELDASQEIKWHDMANSTLIFVRVPPSLHNISVAESK